MVTDFLFTPVILKLWDVYRTAYLWLDGIDLERACPLVEIYVPDI